jgi:hypothetical protein
MDLSANRSRLTPEEHKKRILEEGFLYCGRFGHVVHASPNKVPFVCPLYENKDYVVPFSFNVSTMQTAPIVLNTESIPIIPPSSKLVEN